MVSAGLGDGDFEGLGHGGWIELNSVCEKVLPPIREGNRNM